MEIMKSVMQLDEGSEGNIQSPNWIAPEDRITMTERAARHVMSELRKHEDAHGFRLGVRKTGCSGLAYTVDLARELRDDDIAFAINPELTVYVDPRSFKAIKGTRIDYTRDGLNMMFKFANPNIAHECGCGESFSI